MGEKDYIIKENTCVENEIDYEITNKVLLFVLNNTNECIGYKEIRKRFNKVNYKDIRKILNYLVTWNYLKKIDSKTYVNGAEYSVGNKFVPISCNSNSSISISSECTLSLLHTDKGKYIDYDNNIIDYLGNKLKINVYFFKHDIIMAFLFIIMAIFLTIKNYDIFDRLFTNGFNSVISQKFKIVLLFIIGGFIGLYLLLQIVSSIVQAFKFSVAKEVLLSKLAYEGVLEYSKYYFHKKCKHIILKDLWGSILFFVINILINIMIIFFKSEDFYECMVSYIAVLFLLITLLASFKKIRKLLKDYTAIKNTERDEYVNKKVNEICEAHKLCHSIEEICERTKYIHDRKEQEVFIRRQLNKNLICVQSPIIGK